MSDTQANTIRDLLLAALYRYDSSIELRPGSRAYTQIVEPVYNAMTPDMFDTDLDEYILSVLREEYPSLELQEGDAIVDLLVKPLRLILQPVKLELELLKKRQSVTYASDMTLEDAEDLASNFFVTRQRGARSRGTVRILLSSPTFLSITDQVRFSTSDGLRFYPIRQQYINAETTALQQIGTLYYVDIGVIAEQEGDEYNIDPNTISVVEGIPNFVSATNPFSFEQGTASETKEQLLARTEQSLTERSLTSRRGITARLRSDYPDLRSVSVVGFGDPEMERDVITASGEGLLLSSGISFIVGKYMFTIAGYEDNGDGHQLPAAGDKVKLNFWKFMYQTSSIETNYIEEVIYSSYGDAPDLPTVSIFLLKNDIEREPISGGYLPGVYLGVFTSIFSDATITISGVPTGVVNGLTIPSNEVHIGGKYDVWVRPATIDTSSSATTIVKTHSVLEDVEVFFDGDVMSEVLSDRYPLNRAGLEYYFETSSHSLLEREVISGNSGQAQGFIERIDGNKMYVTARTGSFSVGESISGATSGESTSIQAIVYTEADFNNIGSVLTTTAPQDTYYILDTFENYYILSKEVTTAMSEVNAYIHNKTGIKNIFDPVFKIYPETAEFSSNMQTYTGKDTVEISDNILREGVTTGDVLEILSGEDIGKYTIVEIRSSATLLSTIVLDSNLTRTNSYVRYRIIREGASVDAPLVRIVPGGIKQSAPTGEGYTIPYKKPVGAYALGAFSGTAATHTGVNGLVLPNMPSQFKGDGATIASLRNQADPNFLSLFSNASVDDCISEGCTSCDDLTVTCTVTIDGGPSDYSAVKFYMTGLLSSSGVSYLSDFRQWVQQIISAFFRGQNSQNLSLFDDLTSFVDQFAPIYLGEPPVNEHIIKQFEVCVPLELFNGYNNSYLAIPEFLWDSEFESVNTFSEAITELLSGRLRAKPTALRNAKPGDALDITSGSNKGVYVIDKVLNIPWYHGDTISTESTVNENGVASVTTSIVDNKAYDLTLVFVKGEFPHEVLKGSSTYFSQTLPTVNSLLPTVPTVSLNSIHTIDIATGAFKNPFDVVQEAYTLLFKSMYTQGFDLPEEFNLDAGPTLTRLFKTFFSAYTIGNRSPKQTTRLLFQDPVDCTVFAPRSSTEIVWKREQQKLASVAASSDISLPISIGGSTVSVYTSLNSGQTSTTYSGTVDSAASTVAHIDELVSYIQDALDITRAKLKLSYTTSTTQPTTYRLSLALLQGGQGSYIKPDHTTGLATAGFTQEEVGSGYSTRASGNTVARTLPHNGTKFSHTVGSTNAELVVDIQNDRDFYTSILPGATTALSVGVSDLSRDCVFSDHYDMAESCTMVFTDSDKESALEAGVSPGDTLLLHEQVCILDNTGLTANPFSSKKDRVLHVVGNFTRKSVSLLNTAGTFLTPESTNARGESPAEDVVEPGDIVVFEELGETAVVTRVTETELFLQEDISFPVSQTVLQSGRDGLVSGDLLRSNIYTFVPNDIGNYIVIYGSENSGVDGTYTIDAVTAGVATLSETFDVSETDLHWFILKPSFDEIGESVIGGFSTAVGVTPIRIYRGTPAEFTIADVNHFLDRNKSSIEILYGDRDGGPRRGVRQLFQVVRPYEYRISANQMRNQGKDAGFYYMDVPTTTLTPSFDMNIPENTQYTPVVDTMKTYGYDLITKNRATVYSTKEECELLLDSMYIPDNLNGSLANTQSPEGARIELTYEASTEASILQAFLESDLDRNLCSDPLVRHYLPSIVMLEVTGGSVNEIAEASVIEYINGLSPTDSIRLSDIERELHRSNVDVYDHPIFIQCMTHDLNRDIILTRVDNFVDDSTILHSGTNRITYFIANAGNIKVGSEIE